MAKNKEILSPEEMLQNALVPDWEQPYSVPENWVWTRLGHITTIVGGGTPSSYVNDYYENGTIPWISPADLSGYGDVYISHGKKSITELGLSKSSARLLPRDSVLLSSRAPIGYVAIAANELSTNQGFKSFLPSKGYISKYLYWFLRGSKDILESIASGTTFLELSGSKAAEVLLPIAPLTEQQRIVDRIERLFSKLGEAKEKAQAALDSYENLKAAILHKAFTGELTKKWREENGVSLNSWETHKLGKCGEWFGGGTPTTSIAEYWDDGTVLWVTPKDMKSDIIVDTIYHITETAIENSSAKLIVDNAILFVVRSGILRRILPIAMTKCPVTVNQDIKALVPQNASQEYIFWACIANEKSIRYSCSKSGTTVESISTDLLHKYMIPISTPEEQTEIVRILDSIFGKEQKAKELSDVIEKIDLMKKATLARAFRGELGTNDSEDESAKELLKSILADKKNTVPSIKEKGKAKKKESVLTLEGIKVPMTILEALSEYKSLTPEELKAHTGIKDIDIFYAELKNLVDTGAVIERREGDESYLEVNYAGRQA